MVVKIEARISWMLLSCGIRSLETPEKVGDSDSRASWRGFEGMWETEKFRGLWFAVLRALLGELGDLGGDLGTDFDLIFSGTGGGMGESRSIGDSFCGMFASGFSCQVASRCIGRRRGVDRVMGPGDVW